jgi:hypothetical protein
VLMSHVPVWHGHHEIAWNMHRHPPCNAELPTFEISRLRAGWVVNVSFVLPQADRTESLDQEDPLRQSIAVRSP